MKHNIDEMQKNMINGLAEEAWDLFVKTEAYEEIINSGGIEEDKTYVLVRSLYHSLKEAILETQIEKWQKQSKDELIKELQTQSRCLTFLMNLCTRCIIKLSMKNLLKMNAMTLFMEC